MPLLDLPPRFQRDDFSCGAVAVEVALVYDGISPGRWLRRLASPVTGMSAETVEAVMFGAYGGRTVAGAMNVPLLKHLTSSGRPVVCLITNSAGGGHWVTVRGVHRGRVHYHCPTNGRETLPVATWLSQWHLTDAVGNWVLPCHGVVGLPPVD